MLWRWLLAPESSLYTLSSSSVKFQVSVIAVPLPSFEIESLLTGVGFAAMKSRPTVQCVQNGVLAATCHQRATSEVNGKNLDWKLSHSPSDIPLRDVFHTGEGKVA